MSIIDGAKPPQMDGVLAVSGPRGGQANNSRSGKARSKRGKQAARWKPRRNVLPLKPICKAENIGRRVSTFWDGDGEWFSGQIVSYNKKTEEVEVLYDDGEKLWDHLSARDTVFLPYNSASQSIYPAAAAPAPRQQPRQQPLQQRRPWEDEAAPQVADKRQPPFGRPRQVPSQPAAVRTTGTPGNGNWGASLGNTAAGGSLGAASSAASFDMLLGAASHPGPQ